jgi:2-methylcitrate dehydratase PrpD
VSATAAAAAFVRRLSLENVSRQVRNAALESILDTFACALAARDERVSAGVRDFVAAEGTRTECALWGSALRASPSRAALANGAAAHALDYDDVNWAMNGHPSAPLLPAALAVAEARRAGGRDLLAAYVAGFEVQARVGQAISITHYARGWHPTATLGALGATAAAGKLFGLDEAALRRAFGIAASQLAGSRMNFGTDAKPLHAGLAAQTGVLSAELAARGVTAREDALEAEMGVADLYDGHPPLELGPLGAPFALRDPGVELKPYPSCRFTHRTIDAVLELRARHPRAQVDSMECAIDPFALKILIYPTPRTGLEAKFSLPYCAAIAWLDGWPTLDSFRDERLARADVQEFMRRVVVREASGDQDQVSIALRSGFRASERVKLARGAPARPLTEEERLRKVRGCAAPVLGEERCERLIAAVAALEDVRDARALSALLVPAEGSS